MGRDALQFKWPARRARRIRDAGRRSTEMVHGRARAPPRQTWRVAVNEVGTRMPPAREAAVFFILSKKRQTSKRDVITNWRPPTLVNHTLFRSPPVSIMTS